MSMPVAYERQDDIAVVTVNNPPVNALSQTVRQGLLDALALAMADDKAKAVVVLGAGRTFIAGADIREFGKPPMAPRLSEVVSAYEDAPKPVIAALHGTALGGGLEFALGCHYRVAVTSAKAGLPEVHLGLIPGAGGTVRTPLLTGAAAAIDMVTTGRQVPAHEAQQTGLLDAVYDTYTPLEAGLQFARKAIDENMPVRRARDVQDKLEADRAKIAELRESRAAIEKTARGQTSPLVGLDAVLATLEMPFEEALKNERTLFEDLLKSDQSKALIHAFFSERQVGKVPELETGKPRDIAKIGVIGGGTMGSGISLAMLNAGIPVTMVERDDDALTAGRGRVEETLQGGIKRGKMTEEKMQHILSDLFSGSTDLADLADADLVIEAVFEDMDVKKDIFARLDKICKPGAVLASNTSYLDINEIAAVTSRPEDVIGLHFFSPANIMRLLEIVVADKTSPDVTATGFALAKRTGKIGVRAGVCDGFVGNRILGRYLKVAQMLVEDGASPYDVDAAVVEFGYPMGPFAMSDMAGLDIGWATRKRKATSRDPRERYSADFIDRVCELGRFGQKTGRGIYIYPDGARRGTPDDEVLAIIDKVRKEKGITARGFSHEEIIERYLAAMINEAVKILDEGIALRPLDIDMVQLAGYAFPRWRGGPMKYADMTGLDTVLASLKKFQEDDDYFWKPAELLVKLVETGQSFDSLNKG